MGGKKLFLSSRTYIILINAIPNCFRYLKGRLTCSQINEVIDSINSVLEMKYSMIRKKFSQIKNTDKIIYNEWKEQDKLSLRGMWLPLKLLLFPDTREKLLQIV